MQVSGGLLLFRATLESRMTTNPEVYEATHPNPVWREKANFIFGAKIIEHEQQVGWEQMWARRLDEFRFEVCCIPFFTYGINLGDEIETDNEFNFMKIINKSGQFGIRIWFGNIRDDSDVAREDICEFLRENGSLLEWSSKNLLAASLLKNRDDIISFLNTKKNRCNIVYEFI